MMSCLAIVALSTQVSVCPVAGSAYTLDDFRGDCRLSGGQPQVAFTNVACLGGSNGDIHCLRVGDQVKACTPTRQKARLIDTG